MNNEEDIEALKDELYHLRQQATYMEETIAENIRTIEGLQNNIKVCKHFIKEII